MVLKKCQRCQTAKGLYIDPEPYLGSVVVNNPLDSVCIEFMKVDSNKDGKGEHFSNDRLF